MGLAYYYQLPESALKQIKAGDTILMSNFGAASSWAVMYYTDSEISHSAIYAGDGKILHMTTSGAKLELLQNHFSIHSRFLPVIIPPGEKATPPEAMADALEKYVSDPRTKVYAYWLVALKWLLIISGRNLNFFRWYHAADVLYICGVAAFLYMVLTGSTALFWLVGIYLGIPAVHRILWLVWPLSFVGYFGAPVSVLAVAEIVDGTVLMDLLGWRNWMIEQLEAGAFDHLVPDDEKFSSS